MVQPDGQEGRGCSAPHNCCPAQTCIRLVVNGSDTVWRHVADTVRQTNRNMSARVRRASRGGRCVAIAYSAPNVRLPGFVLHGFQGRAAACIFRMPSILALSSNAGGPLLPSCQSWPCTAAEHTHTVLVCGCAATCAALGYHCRDLRRRSVAALREHEVRGLLHCQAPCVMHY